jgi:hypothetical protein
MSTPTLATAGGARLELGYSGQPATTNEWSAFSLDNESTSGGLDSAGMIDFGIAVARGDIVGCCKIISSDAHLPIGITMRHMADQVSAATTHYVGYKPTKPVPIMFIGDIYVKVCEAVTAGDQIISVTAEGGKLAGTTGGVVGSGRVLVPGGHWVTSAASGGIALARLTGVSNPRTTT